MHSYIYDLLRKIGLNDFGARTGEFLLVRPAKVLLIVLVAMIVTRLAARWIRRSVRSFQEKGPLRGSARAMQRATTIGDVVVSLMRIVVWGIVLMTVLGQLGIQLAPLLAGAGIAGVAIGFGAQSLVRDFLSGLFILVEDQYGVGDSVDLGDVEGTVEEVSLRVTRVRSLDGTVWYVPNGEIRKVGNASMEWSRALVDVVVPRTVDPALATAAVAEEATAFAADGAWASSIVEGPDVWGVETGSADTVTIRVVVRTAAVDRMRVTRALRARLYERISRERERESSRPPGGPAA